MDKALLDSSTLFDITRALKGRKGVWATNTLGRLAEYERHFPRLTISGITVFELLEGLYRGNETEAIEEFHGKLLPGYEVIQPSIEIEDKAAEIHAKLGLAGLSIDVPDTLIAATAIVHDLTLVNANTRHFARVEDSGFPLRLANWRDDIV
jgi:tRNA(fMet)-specific endonuclease VapC